VSSPRVERLVLRPHRIRHSRTSTLPATPEAALHAAGAPVTAAELAKHFTSTNPAALHEILESLAALGRACVDGERFVV